MVIFEDLGINFRYGLAGVVSTCSEWRVLFSLESVSLLILSVL